MTNRTKKIIAFILTLIIAFFCTYTMVYATSPFTSAIGEFKGKDTGLEGKNFAQDIIKRVLTAIRVFAAGLAIIMITVMGIKYMMAAPTEKAEVKTKLINFIIGVVLVVAATTIIDIVRDFVVKSTEI